MFLGFIDLKLFGAVQLTGLAGFFGLALLYFGTDSLSEGSRAAAEPQSIRCADLIESGHGDNAHVLITEAAPLVDEALIERHYERTHEWQRVCIPLVPQGEEESEKLRLVVVSKHIQSDGQLAEFAKATAVQGIVDREYHMLSSEDREALSRAFPKTDFQYVEFIRHLPSGNKPRTIWQGLLYTAGGMLLFACGGLVMFAANYPALPKRKPRQPSGTELEPIELVSAETEDVLWWIVLNQSGLAFRLGVAVLRPEYLAFLPTGKSLRIQEPSGGSSQGAAAHYPPIQILSSEPNADSALARLWKERRGDFDTCLAHAVQHFRGTIWPRHHGSVGRANKPNASGKESVVFEFGSVTLTGKAPSGPALDHLLSGWKPRKPLSALWLIILVTLPGLLFSLLTPVTLAFGRLDNAFVFGGLALIHWFIVGMLCWREKGVRIS